MMNSDSSVTTLHQAATSAAPESVTPPKPERTPAAAAAAVIAMLPDFARSMLYDSAPNKRKIADQLATLLELKHPAVAKRLMKQFPETLKPVPVPPLNLISQTQPRFGLDSVILSEQNRTNILSLIHEHEQADVLKTFDLHPRHRVLLSGPPGNGKTMIAEALAKELNLPFIFAKYSGVVASHMGETGANLSKLFEYANAVPCVLFLDEFDTLGISRGASNDVGEMRRVTNQLLLQLDRVEPTCVLVAATNTLDTIDTAVRRRFDTPIPIDSPTRDMRLRCANLQLDPSLTPGHDVRDQSSKIAELSQINLDEVVKLCRRIRRDLALHGGQGISDLIEQLRSRAL